MPLIGPVVDTLCLGKPHMRCPLQSLLLYLAPILPPLLGGAVALMVSKRARWLAVVGMAAAGLALSLQWPPITYMAAGWARVRAPNCLENLRSLSLAFHAYATDWDDHLPDVLSDTYGWKHGASEQAELARLYRKISPYVKNWRTWYCPRNPWATQQGQEHAQAGRYGYSYCVQWDTTDDGMGGWMGDPVCPELGARGGSFVGVDPSNMCLMIDNGLPDDPMYDVAEYNAAHGPDVFHILFWDGHASLGPLSKFDVLHPPLVRPRDIAGRFSPWEIQTVDSSAGQYCGTALVLDEQQYPHICYAAARELRYTKWNGSAWETMVVSNPESEKEDREWSAQASGSRRGQTPPVPPPPVTRCWPSLALDASGRPHISYEGNNDLKYAYWDGSAWNIHTVDREAEVVFYTSLVLGHNDHPHISYYARQDGSLRYAAWDGLSWRVQTVDAEGTAGFHSPLALDSHGHPHISYLGDIGAVNLKYARWNGTNG